MKVFYATYYKSYGYGAYDDFSEVIVANTQSEALGFALEFHDKSEAAYWTINEINTNKPGVA